MLTIILVIIVQIRTDIQRDRTLLSLERPSVLYFIIAILLRHGMSLDGKAEKG